MTNVFVDILFVAQFQMGVAGVAWATFLCQGIAAALALGVVIKRLKSLPESEKAPWFSADCLKELSLIAIHLCGQHHDSKHDQWLRHGSGRRLFRGSEAE